MVGGEGMSISIDQCGVVRTQPTYARTHPEAVAGAVDLPGLVLQVGRDELDGLQHRVADGAEGAPEPRVDLALV